MFSRHQHFNQLEEPKATTTGSQLFRRNTKRTTRSLFLLNNAAENPVRKSRDWVLDTRKRDAGTLLKISPKKPAIPKRGRECAQLKVHWIPVATRKIRETSPFSAEHDSFLNIPTPKMKRPASWFRGRLRTVLFTFSGLDPKWVIHQNHKASSIFNRNVFANWNVFFATPELTRLRRARNYTKRGTNYSTVTAASTADLNGKKLRLAAVLMRTFDESEVFIPISMTMTTAISFTNDKRGFASGTCWASVEWANFP